MVPVPSQTITCKCNSAKEIAEILNEGLCAFRVHFLWYSVVKSSRRTTSTTSAFFYDARKLKMQFTADPEAILAEVQKFNRRTLRFRVYFFRLSG